MVEQPERYCRNCGQELRPDDRFCPNCGRPVHESARVPTPEADVPISPPRQQSSGAGAHSETRGPRLTLVGVLVAVGVVETMLEMARTNPGGSTAYQLGYAFGGAFQTTLVVAAVPLVLGVVLYLTYLVRGGGSYVRSSGLQLASGSGGGGARPPPPRLAWLPPYSPNFPEYDFSEVRMQDPAKPRSNTRGRPWRIGPRLCQL
jgi:hypothetical protein